MKYAQTASLSRRRRAYTLVELICAMAVTVLLVLAAGRITLSILEAWTGGRGTLDKTMNSRLALELMAQDLEAAFLVQEGNANVGELLQLYPETDLGPAAHRIPQAAWLMFLSRPLDGDRSEPGDVRAISYRVGYAAPYEDWGGSEMFGLYRHVASPQETFDSAQNTENLKAGFWDARDTLASRDQILSHVLAFEVRFRVRQEDGSLADLPGNAVVRVGEGITIEPDDDGFSGKVELVGALIQITVVSEEGANRIEDGVLDRETVIRNYGTSYSRYVDLSGI